MQKKLHIERLQVSNFKGIKAFTLETDGSTEIVILGDNATGKTTVVDAWCWLLFGKDSAGRATFEVKTLDAGGEAAHGLEHAVEAVVDMGDNTVRKFRKVYKELWTKRRGTASKEFTGHTTDHFIDDVPMKQAEYQARVAELCAEDAFRILTEPGYFAEQLAWQDRRQVVLDVCGDITDSDVIRSSADLADLPEMMGQRTIEELRKVAQARRREINQELERIPVRISEVELGQPDTPEDEAEVQGRLESFRSARKQAQEDHARISAGGQGGELTNELRTTEADMQSLQTGMRIAAEQAVGPKRRAITEAEDVLRNANSEARLARAAIEDAGTRKNYLEAEMAKVQDRWDKLNAVDVGPISVEDTCPTCGRKLAASKVKAARERVLEEFNDDKGSRLAELDKGLAEQRSALATLEALIEGELQPARAAADNKVVDADAAVVAAQAEFAAVGDVAEPDFAADPAWAKANTRKTQVKARLEQLKNEDVDTLQEVAERIEAIDKAIDRDEIIVARFEQKRNGVARIKELKGMERKLASEFEGIERELYLADEFTRTKVALLEKRINEQFKLARFKMFKVLVNGGLEECCEVTYKGVPYSSNLNHGARVQVGLDIISTLQRHYGFAPPVWVDQGESITTLPDIDCQLIQLVVDSGADKLTVNTQQQEDV